MAGVFLATKASSCKSTEQVRDGPFDIWGRGGGAEMFVMKILVCFLTGT